PALHPPADLAGPRRAAGAAVGASRRDSPLASGRGGTRDARATRRSMDPISRPQARRRAENRRSVMNRMETIDRDEAAKLTKARAVPDFVPGDTVKVSVKVVEGERERIQAFEGVCIARKNAGTNSSFTLRKISYGEGVERIFPLYSPRITAIEVVRQGAVRRAKLYYLRGLRGKAARIAERSRDTSSDTDGAAAEAATQEKA